MKDFVKAFALSLLFWFVYRAPQLFGFMSYDTTSMVGDVAWVNVLTVVLFKLNSFSVLQEKLVAKSITHSKLVLYAVLTVFIVCAPGLLRLELVRLWDVTDLPQENELAREYKQFNEVVGEENSFILTLQSTQSVTTPAIVFQLAELEAKIKELEGVNRNKVFSLASLRVVNRDEEGSVEFSKIAQVLKSTSPELQQEKLYQLINATPFAQGRLISDGKVSHVASLVAFIDAQTDVRRLYRDVMMLVGAYPQTDISVQGLESTVRDVVYETFGIAKTQYGAVGFFLLDVATLIAILFIATVLTTIASIFMTTLLVYKFRVITVGDWSDLSSYRYHKDRMSMVTFVSTFIMTVPLVITMGIIGWLGITVDTVTGIIPIVIIVCGTSGSIHLLHYLADTDEKLSNSERIKIGMARASKPITLVTLTTGIGFISLASFELASISKFGIWSAIGTTAVTLPILLYVAPAWFSLKGLPRDGFHEVEKKSALVAFSRQGLRFAKSSWIVIVVMMAGAIALMSQLHIGSRPTRMLDRDSLITRTTDTLNTFMGYNGALSLYLDFGVEGEALAPNNLALVKQFSDYVTTLAHVANTNDIEQALRYLNESYAGNIGTPDSQQLANDLMFVYEGEEETPFLAGNDRYAVVYVWGDYEKSNDVSDIYDAMQVKAKELGLKLTVGSEFLLWVAQTKYLVTNKLISWLQAVLLNIILVYLVYRRWSAGIVIAVPLLFATLMILGVMSIFGISLDIASTVITTITVGVGIDFATHMYEAIIENQKRGLGIDDAIEQALAHNSKPIIDDATVNALGFSVFIFAPLQPVVHCGWMLVFSMFICTLCALILVPLLVKLFHKEKIS